MQEEFKDVIGYEGVYQVSNIGNVKSLSRKMVKGKAVFISKEKNLKQSIAKDGYFVVVLCSDIQKTFKIHQLVAMAFLGHKPCGFELVINHKDFNKLNNNLDNLEIVTARENSNKKHLKSSSQYTGVSWDKRSRKWISSLEINKKQVHLGLFENEIEASEYYQNALISLSKGEKILIRKAIFTSKYKGVSFEKCSKKWRSYIYINGKRKNLGRFNTELEAYNERQKKIKLK